MFGRFYYLDLFLLKGLLVSNIFLNNFLRLEVVFDFLRACQTGP